MLPKVTSWKPCNVRVSEFPQVIGVASEVTGKRVMGIRGKGACHTALYLPTSKMLVYSCFIGQRDPIGVKKAMRECEKGYAPVGGGAGEGEGSTREGRPGQVVQGRTDVGVLALLFPRGWALL